MHNKEIEIKLLFNNKKEIIRRLTPCVKFLKKNDVFDKYYGKAKSGIKNRNVFFRIREVDGEVELTYKGKAKKKEEIIERKEINMKISSADLMEIILTSLGFKKNSEHYSKREYWSFKEVQIVFVKFIKPAPLEYMEIEADSKEKIEKILELISDCVSRLKENIFSKFDETN